MKTIVIISALLVHSLAFADAEHNAASVLINKHDIASNTAKINLGKIRNSKNKDKFLSHLPPISHHSERPKSLMLRHCSSSGAFQWGPCSVYELKGTGPAGGMVFKISEDGKHGLEAGEILSAHEWGCKGTNVVGAIHLGIGSGETDTDAILGAGCVSENGSPIAAKVASDYNLGGYTDWYLPSRDELFLAYQVLYYARTKDATKFWSSSEVGKNKAWGVLVDLKDNEDSGSKKSEMKPNFYFVVPIRSF